MWAVTLRYNENWKKRGSRWSIINFCSGQCICQLSFIIERKRPLKEPLFTTTEDTVAIWIWSSNTNSCLVNSKSVKAQILPSFLVSMKTPTNRTSVIHHMATVKFFLCISASLSLPGPRLLRGHYSVGTKGHSWCHLCEWTVDGKLQPQNNTLQ